MYSLLFMILYEGGNMHKVLVCGLDTAQLPKITNKEAASWHFNAWIILQISFDFACYHWHCISWKFNIVFQVKITKLPKITNKEADELLLKIKLENDEDAKNKFIMANLRLVLSLIQRFDSKHNSDDLFQVGVILPSKLLFLFH